MCGPAQSYGDPTLDVSVRPRVGLTPLCCKAGVYSFQGIQRLHTQYPINRGNERRKVSTLLEACLQVHIILWPFCLLKTLFGVFSKWYLASVFSACMLWILYVPFCQRLWISRSPFCFVASRCGVYDLALYLSGFAFGLFTAKPSKMRGLLQPHPGACCDAPWQGRPNCSRGYGIWINWRCGCCVIWGGLGDVGHIAGRGNLSIPEHPVPYIFLLTAASSAMNLSLLTSTSNVRLGQGTPLRSPPGPPLPVGCSASAPPISPLGGRWSVPPSRTPTGPWALQRCVLWWHRTSSRS